MAITKEWVSAQPKVNADGKVTEWSVKYKYTDGNFSHTFQKSEIIKEPSKAPSGYSKAEILILMDEDHWDSMFAKKNNIHKNPPVADSVQNDFDINTLK